MSPPTTHTYSPHHCENGGEPVWAEEANLTQEYGHATTGPYGQLIHVHGVHTDPIPTHTAPAEPLGRPAGEMAGSGAARALLPQTPGTLQHFTLSTIMDNHDMGSQIPDNGSLDAAISKRIKDTLNCLIQSGTIIRSDSDTNGLPPADGSTPTRTRPMYTWVGRQSDSGFTNDGSEDGGSQFGEMSDDEISQCEEGQDTEAREKFVT